MDWVEQRHTEVHPNVFWLRGPAGSGKSTVANTIAQAVRDRDYLLSCFFCKRDDQNLSTPTRVLPTLAYSFAQHYDSYRAAIFPLVSSDPRAAGLATNADVSTQLRMLFEEPLGNIVDPLRPHVIIIDALDECGSPRDQANLARCILTLSRLTPWIKVFVTSRAEPSIDKVFRADACIHPDINKEIGTEHDIRQYIDSQLLDLEIELSPPQIGQLVQRAEGLFIWCATLFKLLRGRLGVKKTLEMIISGQDERGGSWNELYRLYDVVLDTATQDDDDRSFMQVVLSIVGVAARNRPISAKTIVSFLQDHAAYSTFYEELETLIGKLHAVLYIDGSTNCAVRAYHTSFYDFLEHKATTAGSGWELPEVTHRRMFQRCLAVLSTQLRFNICRIEDPVLNKDIPDLAARISQNLSEELQYSSCFWHTHLSPSKLTASVVSLGVTKLLTSWKLLFWLETLSLQSALAQSISAFSACTGFFHVSAIGILWHIFVIPDPGARSITKS